MMDMDNDNIESAEEARFGSVTEDSKPTESNDKLMAAGAWLGPIITLGFPVVAAVFIWGIKETKQKPFLFEHCRQAFVFQAIMFIIGAILGAVFMVVGMVFGPLTCVVGPLGALVGFGALALVVLNTINAFNEKPPFKIEIIAKLAREYIK